MVENMSEKEKMLATSISPFFQYFLWDFFFFFPKQQILDSSKLKEFAEDKFIVDENVRNFLKWIENTAGKGEIAYYEEFLLFPTVFSIDIYSWHLKTRACLGNG